MLSSDDGGPTRLTVAPLTRDDGKEIFEIVGQLEGMAAAGAARLSQAEREGVIQAMAVANDQLRDVGTNGSADRMRFFELDSAFHKACVAEAGSPRLRRLHNAVKPQAERYIRLYVTALLDQIAVSVEEHEALLEEIRAGDPERAHRAMFLNWRNAGLRLDGIIASLGEQGSW
ncbi:MAG: GntR family transcriptional regulator [Gemmatimonadota bacterium]